MRCYYAHSCNTFARIGVKFKCEPTDGQFNSIRSTLPPIPTTRNLKFLHTAPRYVSLRVFSFTDILSYWCCTSSVLRLSFQQMQRLILRSRFAGNKSKYGHIFSVLHLGIKIIVSFTLTYIAGGSV